MKYYEYPRIEIHLHELIDTIQDDVTLEDTEQFINLYLVNNQGDNENKLSNPEKQNNEKNDLPNNFLPMMLV